MLEIRTLWTIGLSLLASSASAALAEVGAPIPRTSEEKAFVKAVDDDYAWHITERLTAAGEVVAGTDKGRRTAETIAAWMRHIGLQAGGKGGSYLEEFPISGWEDLGSSVTVVAPVRKEIPMAQAFAHKGTGPLGVKAQVVDVGYGKWSDFQGVDVTGKIVLFHRADPMFYGLPSLAEAKARGAVGALMDYPVVGDKTLKTDVIHGSLPAVYIRQIDARWIRERLASGNEVTVHLVVNNRTSHRPTAQNVIGVIPGSIYPEELVYLCGHFDHWFDSAADDNAAIASVLTVAKAFIKSGVRPKRTLVFVAWDSEELGGPDSTWYDWLQGSFSHIVKTLDGPALHPDRPGRIAGMLNMDVIATKGTEVFVETTPDITHFIDIAANDAGLPQQAPTSVYWPPSSYDDWSFYMAGVPVMQIAWWGPAYDKLYHTTDDQMDQISPEYLRTNIIFNGFAMLRLAQAQVLPYTLSENISAAEAGIENLVFKAPEADRLEGLANLRDGIAAYRSVIQGLDLSTVRKLSKSQVKLINATMLQAAKALNPHLFDWDVSVIPGWTGLFVLDTYANDLDALNRAIDSLARDDNAVALAALGEVTTMAWGQHVGSAAYADVLSIMAHPAYPQWAEGFIPVLTDVHAEYQQLSKRTGESLDRNALLAALSEKRLSIYASVAAAAAEAGTAFKKAATILRPITKH